MGNLSRRKICLYDLRPFWSEISISLKWLQEWNGSWVHISEYEKKHPQLEPKPHQADPEGLQYAHPDRQGTTSNYRTYTKSIFNN
jgi:hypothetical protein